MADSLEQQCATALLAALKHAPWAITHGDLERLAAGDLDGDDDEDNEQEQQRRPAERKLRRALAVAHGRTLQARVQAALDADGVDVILASNDVLSVEDAELALFQKEEQRVFEPLRKSLDQALSAFDVGRAQAFSSALVQLSVRESDALAPVPPAPTPVSDGPHEAPPATTPLDVAQEALRAFLNATHDAFAGALNALETDGGVRIHNTNALLRALDLGFVDGSFSTERAVRTAKCIKEVARPSLARDIVRVRAPRAFAGHVVTAAAGPIRLLSAPSLRARRYVDQVVGSGVAMGSALFASASSTAESAGRTFGAASAFGVLSPVGMRGIFDDSRQAAERNARTARATILTGACAAATAASVVATLMAQWEAQAPARTPALLDNDEAQDIVAAREEELGETLRAALSKQFGHDVGPHFGRALLAPPLPGGALYGRLMRAGGAALQTGAVAAHTLALRDRYDEAFALVPAPYACVREASIPLERGAVTLGALFDVDRLPGPALSEWMLELL